MTVFVHPVADEATDRWLVYDTPSAAVLLTEPLQLFFKIAATDGLRPVLVTGPDVRLSPFATAALAEAGGSWVARSEDGPFDAVTGQSLTSFDDLWCPPTGPHPLFVTLPLPDRTVVTYDMYATQRAEPETRVGRTAQAMTAALGGSDLDLWGTAEPLLDTWDADRITAFARARMPRTPALLALGPHGEYARTWLVRYRHGLVERTTGGVPTATPDTLADLVPPAAAALATARSSRVDVLLALAWACARTEDATSAPGPRPADQPLAALVGPRAVRDLDIDTDDLATRYDTQVLGRSRAPSLLVRFSAPDTDLWTQLAGLVHDLDAHTRPGPETDRSTEQERAPDAR